MGVRVRDARAVRVVVRRALPGNASEAVGHCCQPGPHTGERRGAPCVRFVASVASRPAAAQLSINGKSGSRSSLSRGIPELIGNLEIQISAFMDQSLVFPIDFGSLSHACGENVALMRHYQRIAAESKDLRQLSVPRRTGSIARTCRDPQHPGDSV